MAEDDLRCGLACAVLDSFLQMECSIVELTTPMRERDISCRGVDANSAA